MRFILSGIHFGWGLLKTGFSLGEIRVRRDSVLASFTLGEIHFGGISDDGFWNGGILSYSRPWVHERIFVCPKPYFLVAASSKLY